MKELGELWRREDPRAAATLANILGRWAASRLSDEASQPFRALNERLAGWSAESGDRLRALYDTDLVPCLLIHLEPDADDATVERTQAALHALYLQFRLLERLEQPRADVAPLPNDLLEVGLEEFSRLLTGALAELGETGRARLEDWIRRAADSSEPPPSDPVSG